MASRVPITALSAACIVVSWILLHGREPRWSDCRTSNGLLACETIRKSLPGDTLSACISAARILVSHAPPPRMQTCLGPDCDVSFVYQGYHFCQDCRQALGYADEDTRTAGRYLRAHDREAAERASGLEMHHLGRRTLREQDESAELLLWLHTNEDAEDERIYGFDDMVARQMNAWSRVTPKRRFFEGA